MLTAPLVRAEDNKPGYIGDELAYETAEDEYKGDGIYLHTLKGSLYRENDPNVSLYGVQCNSSDDDGAMDINSYKWTMVQFSDRHRAGRWVWHARYNRSRTLVNRETPMKLFLILAVTVVTLAGHAFADDWYRIRNVNTLITASHGDLEAFMDLNARHQKSAVRTLYRTLENRNALFNIQPGTLVRVVDYYGDGIAKIEWGDGAYTGYINIADLSEYLGSE